MKLHPLNLLFHSTIIMLLAGLLSFFMCTQQTDTEGERTKDENNTEASTASPPAESAEQEGYQPKKQTRLSSQTLESKQPFRTSDPLSFFPEQTSILIQSQNLQDLDEMIQSREFISQSGIDLSQIEATWQLISGKPFPFPENLAEYSIDGSQPIGIAYWDYKGTPQLSLYASLLDNPTQLDSLIQRIENAGQQSAQLNSEMVGDYEMLTIRTQGGREYDSLSFIKEPVLLLNFAIEPSKEETMSGEGLKHLLELQTTIKDNERFTKLTRQSEIVGDVFIYADVQKLQQLPSVQDDFQDLAKEVEAILLGVNIAQSAVQANLAIIPARVQLTGTGLVSTVCASNTKLLAHIQEKPLGVLSFCVDLSTLYTYVLTQDSFSSVPQDLTNSDSPKAILEQMEQLFNSDFAPLTLKTDIIDSIQGNLLLTFYDIPNLSGMESLDFVLELGIKDSEKINTLLGAIFQKNYVLTSEREFGGTTYHILQTESLGFTPALAVKDEALLLASSEDRLKKQLSNTDTSPESVIESDRAKQILSQDGLSLFIDSEVLNQKFPVVLFLSGYQLAPLYNTLRHATLSLGSDDQSETFIVNLTLEGTDAMLEKLKEWLINRMGGDAKAGDQLTGRRFRNTE